MPDPPPLAELDDDRLMQLARDGRREAFHVLVRRHQDRAVAFGTRYLGQRATARDAAQESFLELFLSLPRYEARGRFVAYWHQILLNQCRMSARARDTASAATARLVTVPPGPAPLAEEALIASQEQRDVERALQGLSEKLRVVVALRFGGGLSLQEIADTLALPVGTVKSRLFSGLAALRQTLRGIDA